MEFNEFFEKIIKDVSSMKTPEQKEKIKQEIIANFIDASSEFRCSCCNKLLMKDREIKCARCKTVNSIVEPNK